MYELKKMGKYLRVNLSGPEPRLMKTEFTGPRSHKFWETLIYGMVVILMTGALHVASYLYSHKGDRNGA